MTMSLPDARTRQKPVAISETHETMSGRSIPQIVTP
jgi:hypothetical protein